MVQEQALVFQALNSFAFSADANINAAFCRLSVFFRPAYRKASVFQAFFYPGQAQFDSFSCCFIREQVYFDSHLESSILFVLRGWVFHLWFQGLQGRGTLVSEWGDLHLALGGRRAGAPGSPMQPSPGNFFHGRQGIRP